MHMTRTACRFPLKLFWEAFHGLPIATAMILVIGMAWHGVASCQVNEDKGMAVATELKTLVNESTWVISELQSTINAGGAADKVAPAVLYSAFLTRYAQVSFKPFDEKGNDLEGEVRRSFAVALRETLAKFEPTMVKGGTDAFVPAFFRAQLLRRFNARMTGKVQAYATNRDKDLINADWAVAQVMKGSPLLSDVSALMNTQKLTPVTKRLGDRVMAYWPMKLGEGCVSCHARNNLKQNVGEFGGALVAEVWVK
jgi:hypothetical protein